MPINPRSLSRSPGPWGLAVRPGPRPPGRDPGLVDLRARASPARITSPTIPTTRPYHLCYGAGVEPTQPLQTRQLCARRA